MAVMGSEEERQAWIDDVKRRLGIRCIGDEALAPEWPVLEEGVTCTVVSEQAMASPDGVHFYVKPGGMTTAEFLALLRLCARKHPSDIGRKVPPQH